jgi:hypothetical protein
MSGRNIRWVKLVRVVRLPLLSLGLSDHFVVINLAGPMQHMRNIAPLSSLSPSPPPLPPRDLPVPGLLFTPPGSPRRGALLGAVSYQEDGQSSKIGSSITVFC